MLVTTEFCNTGWAFSKRRGQYTKNWDAMNMPLDELIIELIRQDLKHNQLIVGLDRLNLDAGYCHYLGITELIQKLMGISEKSTDVFTATYMGYMQRCMDFPVSNSGEELLELARECFESLGKLEE